MAKLITPWRGHRTPTTTARLRTARTRTDASHRIVSCADNAAPRMKRIFLRLPLPERTNQQSLNTIQLKEDLEKPLDIAEGISQSRVLRLPNNLNPNQEREI